MGGCGLVVPGCKACHHLMMMIRAMAIPFVYTQLVSVSLVSSQLNHEGLRSAWENSDSDGL
jgi:hypothetical protein